MAVDRIAYIKERYNVLDYARNTLHLPVHKAGDRCTSIAPGPHKTNNAFVVYKDWWYDFSSGCGGDVIDLCAEAKYGGDKGAAIRELAGDYGGDWKRYTEQLCDKIAYFHSQLRDEDREYIVKRGINAETIERLKLGYDAKEDRLTIPYFKNGYVAYYIGRDRSGKEGASKYKKSFLDGLNENIAWGLHSFMPERRKQILESTEDEAKKAVLEKFCVIAEGAFDAMSFEQEGFKVLSPISGYFNKDTLKQVVSLCKTQECVFICFDNDNAGSKFQINMAQTLFRHKIRFVCGSLPRGFKDISEYYEQGGNLFSLIEKAASGVETLVSRITDRDEFEKFVYEAARFMKKPDFVELFEHVEQFPKSWLAALLKEAYHAPLETMIVQEVLTEHSLKYAEGQGFFEYSHGVWEKIADNVVRNYCSGKYGRWSTGSKLNTALVQLKSSTTTEELFNRQPIFNFRNCILDLKTGETEEHSPAFLSTVQVDYDYDAEADCPRWKQFISEVMAGRELSMKLLQEMAGYILFEDCSLQKCFFLMGDGANGKSVFLNTIQKVFGTANVSNVQMSNLDEPFQRINLINSLVNISTETSTNIKGAESIFKQVVVGDTINGCYKNKDFVNFKPRCVMISACNEYVKSNDTTKGFLRRICFIDFPCHFEGEKADINLEKKLEEELSGIFNWAYEGYKSLQAQKHFTKTPEQVEMMKEFTQLAEPVLAFINEELVGYVGDMERSELYNRYKKWCESAGHKPKSRNSFTHAFRQAVGQLMLNVIEKTVHGQRFFRFVETFTPQPIEDFWNEEDEETR